MEEGKSNSTPESPTRTSSAPELGQSTDLIVGDYMERLGTRLGILETELRYAWRALDLLSQEYIKMWERLEKLELLLYEQQSVIAQLIDFYSSVDPCDNEGELLGRPRIIQGMNSIDQTGLLNSDPALSNSAAQLIDELKLEMDIDGNLPDEYFYRSLNNAYRNDMVCPSISGASQLGMIWEESEEDSNGTTKREENHDLVTASNVEPQVFSSLDYKDYRGSSPCVSEHDLVPISQLSTIDQVAIEKLKELDRLTSKLQKDSQNLKDLQDRLLADSPKHKYTKDTTDVSEIKVREDKTNDIDAQLKMMCAESQLEDWGFSTTTQAISDMLRLTSAQVVPSSLGPGYMSTPSSPRTFSSQNIVYSSTSRLHNLDSSFTEINDPHRSLAHSPKSYETDSSVLDESVLQIDSTRADMLGYSMSNDRVSSPTPSVVRTRQDGYIEMSFQREVLELEAYDQSTVSPPPPAPTDSNIYLMPNEHMDSVIRKSPAGMYNTQGLSTSTMEIQGRHSPRNSQSPKSPRVSPKHTVGKSSLTIITAKSDSGLSSMSGWSSLEKSPDVMNSKPSMSYASENLVHIGRISQQHPLNPPIYCSDSSVVPTSYNEMPDYRFCGSENGDFNHLLPGGLRVSTFTPVHTPTNHPNHVFTNHSLDGLHFVPPPAPEAGVSPNTRQSYAYEAPSAHNDFIYYNEQPAIYSVAGSHRQDFTSVYTSGAADYLPTTTVSSYPDIIDTNQYSSCRPGYGHRSQSIGSYPITSTSKRSLSRNLSVGSVPSGGAGVYDMDEYKTAMYRTMFPTGNITDALTYYPTNNTCAGQPQTSEWVTGPTPRNQAWSTIRSASVDTCDHQRYYQGGVRDISHSDMDIRSTVTTEGSQRSSDYYGPSSVIVSQSGYISIASDIKEPQDEKSKKGKRGGLKSAMSSVSSWLPDIHISKRYRSYSLPTGVRREDLVLTKENGKQLSQAAKSKQSPSSRKKNKMHIVSTMSGFLQKAKSKTQRFHHSLSDPEHSETEWSSKQIGVSEDSEPDSVFSDAQDGSCFAKISGEKNVQGINESKPQSPKGQEQLHSETSTVEADEKFLPESRPDIYREHRLMDINVENMGDNKDAMRPLRGKSTCIRTGNTEALDDRICQRKENMPDMMIEPIDTIRTNDYFDNASVTAEEANQNTIIDIFDDDSFDASSMFATIGEVKKVSPSQGFYDEDTSEGVQLPPVTIGSASREFAVSRALGKYRRRQSNSQLDDTSSTEEQQPTRTHDEIFTVMTTDEEEEELRRNAIFERINAEETNKHFHMTTEEQYNDGSPYTTRNIRNHPPPRQQTSLDIPWGGRGSADTDDDNRSTHSWRSTSRVSSRRQSTEDSIDSEDEWYCYELRKLEELERQSKLEADMELLPEDYEPLDDVRNRMSFVLNELRSKVQVPEDREDMPSNRRGSRDVRWGNVEVTVRRGSYERIDDRPGDRYECESRRGSYERIAMEPRRLSQDFTEKRFRMGTTDEEKRGSFKDRRDTINNIKQDLYETSPTYDDYYHHTILGEERHHGIQKGYKKQNDKEKYEDKYEEMSEASSGATSGPDSPQQSAEEGEVDEAKAIEEELEMMRRSSNSSGIRTGPFSREGSLSVPPSEMSVSMMDEWDMMETLLMREGSSSVPGSHDLSCDHPGTPSLPRFKAECDPSMVSTEEAASKDGGPMGSKWKLLKALKERKAELKSQEAAQGETTVSSTLVGE